MDTVRIKQFSKDHINAYARVVSTNICAGTVCVSNMNMPFQGTLANVEFKLDQVEFIQPNGIVES